MIISSIYHPTGISIFAPEIFLRDDVQVLLRTLSYTKFTVGRSIVSWFTEFCEVCLWLQFSQIFNFAGQTFKCPLVNAKYLCCRWVPDLELPRTYGCWLLFMLGFTNLHITIEAIPISFRFVSFSDIASNGWICRSPPQKGSNCSRSLCLRFTSFYL